MKKYLVTLVYTFTREVELEEATDVWDLKLLDDAEVQDFKEIKE